MKKTHIHVSFILFLILGVPLMLPCHAGAETVGKGARIIEYGVPDEPRFHMGAAVGGSVKLTAEATGTKVLTQISFTSGDPSVCSVVKEGDYWLVSRLKEGSAVIRMSCKANSDTVVRTLLMSNLTPLSDEGAEEDEDDVITGTLKSGSTVYLGCSDVEGITSYETEVKTITQGDRPVEVVSQCSDFYRVELEDESTFGDSDEMWGYVRKSSVYIPVRRIRMKEELSVFEQNTETLQAAVYPQIATNRGIHFSTSNKNAATVDENGTVRGVHRGRAVITAVSADNEELTAKCGLNVKAYVPVTGIVMDPQTLEIENGTAGKIKAHVVPENATETGITWSSSGEGILRIDSKGRYLALKPGVSTVTAVSKEGGFRASCVVTVKRVDAKGVYIQDTLSLDAGEVKIPVWRMLPDHATNRSVTWVSDNPEVAKVDSAGHVTGVRPGETDLHITTEEGGFHRVCRVTVEIYVKNIRLKDTSFTMPAGKTKYLQAQITPEKRTKEKIVWRSEDPSVVTVTQDGKIRAAGIGTGRILVYDAYRGAYDYAMVHVKAGLSKPGLSGRKKGKQFVLTWKKVKNATGYSLYQYNRKKKRYILRKELGKGRTKYSIKNAKKGTKYRLRASYRNGDKKEDSKYSRTVTVK